MWEPPFLSNIGEQSTPRNACGLTPTTYVASVRSQEGLGSMACDCTRHCPRTKGSGCMTHVQSRVFPFASGERRRLPTLDQRGGSGARLSSAAHKRSPRFASPEKSQPEQTISAFPSRTPVEGTRPISVAPPALRRSAARGARRVASRSRAGERDQSVTISAPATVRGRAASLFLRRFAGSVGGRGRATGEGYTA